MSFRRRLAAIGKWRQVGRHLRCLLFRKTAFARRYADLLCIGKFAIYQIQFVAAIFARHDQRDPIDWNELAYEIRESLEIALRVSRGAEKVPYLREQPLFFSRVFGFFSCSNSSKVHCISNRIYRYRSPKSRRIFPKQPQVGRKRLCLRTGLEVWKKELPVRLRQVLELLSNQLGTGIAKNLLSSVTLVQNRPLGAVSTTVWPSLPTAEAMPPSLSTLASLTGLSSWVNLLKYRRPSWFSLDLREKCLIAGFSPAANLPNYVFVTLEYVLIPKARDSNGEFSLGVIWRRRVDFQTVEYSL